MVSRFLVVLLTLPLLLVSACGSSGDHDDADVTFAQQMIPHHQQAVFMAALAPTAGAGPEVTGLAERISAAQDPEIATMRGLLKGWGLNEMSGDMNGMDSGDGMASDDDLDTLAQLRGPAFDQKFLTLMIAHHTGAIAMAETELADGQDSDARRLAQQIIDAQQREITTMKGLQQ